MIKNWLAAGAVALTVGMTTDIAHAASVTQPGEQVGLAYGPLPEGVYAINTFSYGRADARNSPGIGVNIPILVWSTGYKVFGATIMPVIAVPSVFVNTNNPAPLPNQDLSVFYNPFVGSIFAFDLGNKISAAYLVGAYIGVGDRGSLLGSTPVLPQLASTSIRNTGGLSYTGDGYNLTMALTHILVVDDQARFGGPVGARIGPVGNADGLYLDVTATRTFGKFEIGAVAFGYTDLPVNYNIPAYANFLGSGARYQRAGTVAAGGLIGYDFGPFKAQAWITRTIADRGGPDAEETRGWFRIIAPLYSAPAVAAAQAPLPLVRKY